MCGIVGLVANSAVNQDIYDALTVLQHRGQDAAGIMTSQNQKIYLRKGKGLVRDVIRTSHMLRLQGNMGLGHVRYPTAGGASASEAQPLYVNSPYGLCIAHNGNLVNAEELKHSIINVDLRHLNTNSDSEILLNIFAHELQQTAQHQLTSAAIFKAVANTHKRCVGGYATIIMIPGYGILGFRDPNAIRPLIYGKRQKESGTDYIMASESVVLDSLGFEKIADVAPGEAVWISLNGDIERRQCADNPQYNPCIFEQVYLARPDSMIDNILVYKFRLQLGVSLAEKILQLYPNHDIDVVIPIPDTSRAAALPLANRLGVKYREGFIKNRYIGRTFIMPGQKLRKKTVKQKLNTISLEFKDKNILLVDDSIVRGTTSKEIIQMAREAGARKVYFASAAPEVRYPNVYGIDMPTCEELVAYNRTVEEVADYIGADWLVYQDLQALYDAAHEGNPSITRFEDSVFSGDYITGGVNKAYLTKLAAERSDDVKSQDAGDEQQFIEVYNDEE